MNRHCFLQSFLASAILVAAVANALSAELKGDQNKLNTCLIIAPSEQMEALARQIVKAAILNQSWSALELEFNSEVRRTAHERCAISTERAISSEFDAVFEHQLRFRFYMAINDALGGRAISPKVRPTFDSGTVARCLLSHSRSRHKSLVVATVYDKLSGNPDEPGYKALSTDLKAMARHHCALKPKQVSGPQFRVTIADYIYDSSFALLMPLLSAPR